MDGMYRGWLKPYWKDMAPSELFCSTLILNRATGSVAHETCRTHSNSHSNPRRAGHLGFLGPRCYGRRHPIDEALINGSKPTCALLVDQHPPSKE